MTELEFDASSGPQGGVSNLVERVLSPRDEYSRGWGCRSGRNGSVSCQWPVFLDFERKCRVDWKLPSPDHS